MFTILLSILVSTSVLALPTQSNSPLPWSSLRNDKSLARFQSTLLNETMLTFLSECYSENASTRMLRTPCALYFDAVLQLNNTNFVAQQPTIIKLFNESSTNKDFCNRTHAYPSKKNYDIPTQDLNDRLNCGYMCTQENKVGDLVPKPICAFLAWMGEQIKNSTKPAGPPVPPPAGNVAGPANGSISHVVAANVSASREVGKPESVEPAKKPEVPNQVANVQSNISAQTTKKDELKQIQSIAKPNPVSTQQKETPVAPVVPPASVPEKQQTITTKEDQEDPPPTVGADTQEEEALLPTNQGKQDAAANNNQQLNANENANENPNENDSDVDPDDINPEDDDTDEFELREEKLKPKETALVPEDDDAEHKGTQNAIDHNYLNYLPNTNHVTDPFLEESGSNFFTYFLIGMFMCIVLYVLYHNKSKILALLLEGRRGDKGRGGRRKHTAAYRKLDSNLEEAITSSASGRTTQIIY